MEIGDELVCIEFSIPVCIALDGQAGGCAFYIDGVDGSTVPADRACREGDTESVNRQPGGAGECQLDSGSGDKVIYAYRLTRFGTAASVRGTPPPSFDTCSVDIGLPSLDTSASAGGYSTTAAQALINSGSMPFNRVALEASPWYIDPGDAGLIAATRPFRPRYPRSAKKGRMGGLSV